MNTNLAHNHQYSLLYAKKVEGELYQIEEKSISFHNTRVKICLKVLTYFYMNTSVHTSLVNIESNFSEL